MNESRYVTKLIGSQVEKHPLIEVPAQQNHQTSMATNLSKKGCGLVQTSWGGIDPLSAVLELQSPEESFTLDPSARTSSYTSPDFVPWNRRISEIINKTSAYENSIGISSGGTLINRILSNDSSLNERTQKRLNYLNELDDPLQFNATIVNRSGLMHQMDLLKRSSIDAWNSEQRLRALKTVIQAAKLLSDTSPASLYSTKFALISTLLDSFGQLVYERIFSKCTSLTDLPNAQLTCVNWFQKLASIRELIPRIYVEIALFRSYSFIVPTNDWATEAKGHLIRLSDMIRGISDPLVASFSAAYLARCVFEFFPEDKTIFHQIYVDFITRLVKVSLHKNLFIDLIAID